MKDTLLKIKNWLFPHVEKAALKEIDSLNVLVIKVMTLFYAITLFIAVLLELFGVIKPEEESVALFSLCTGCVFCLVIHLVFRYIQKNHLDNHTLIKTIDVIFSVLIVLWVTSISAWTYSLGHQITTFYCIIFSLVCFTVIHPATSMPLFASAFICLYIIAYSIDGAAEFSHFNFLAFMLISIAGSVEKYRVTVDKVNQNLKSEALNEAYLQTLRHDPLTKSQNRNAFVEDSRNYYGKCIDLCVCDVDNFKLINDNYGHLTGDSVLASLAAILIEKFGDESVFRFGGDEFVIIREPSAETSFIDDWNSIQQDIYDIHFDGIEAHVECSAGVVRGTPKDEKEFQNMISDADRELYRVKNERKQRKQN